MTSARLIDSLRIYADLPFPMKFINHCVVNNEIIATFHSFSFNEMVFSSYDSIGNALSELLQNHYTVV